MLRRMFPIKSGALAEEFVRTLQPTRDAENCAYGHSFPSRATLGGKDQCALPLGKVLLSLARVGGHLGLALLRLLCAAQGQCLSNSPNNSHKRPQVSPFTAGQSLPRKQTFVLMRQHTSATPTDLMRFLPFTSPGK